VRNLGLVTQGMHPERRPPQNDSNKSNDPNDSNKKKARPFWERALTLPERI
jgi:hypothetical protein